MIGDPLSRTDSKYLPSLSTLLGLLLASKSLQQPHIVGPNNWSRWRHLTARRREKTDQLLNRIEASGVVPPPLFNAHHHDDVNNKKLTCEIPTLLNPPIDWDQLDDSIDPIRGVIIRPDTP